MVNFTLVFLVANSTVSVAISSLGVWAASLNFCAESMISPLTPSVEKEDLINRFGKRSGLWSRSTWVPQVTNFCLWATGKTYFLYKLKCWAPRISWLGPGTFGRLVIFCRPQSWKIKLVVPNLTFVYRNMNLKASLTHGFEQHEIHVMNKVHVSLKG